MAKKPTLPTYGASSPGSTGSGGSFPSGENALVILENLGVSSSDTGLYIDPNGNLNVAGQDLVNYFYMTPPERLQLQEQMAATGYLKTTSVTGDMTSASTTAYKELITGAASRGMTVQNYMNSLGGGTLGGIQTQLSLEQQQAETEAAKPITYKPKNDTTLAQALSQAVDQTLGYTPANMQQLTDQFISQIHAQDYANAAEGHTGAEQELTQLHSQESALNKLGTDGVDTVIQAYANAVHGEGNRVATPTGQITNLGRASFPGMPFANPLQTQQPTTGVNAPGTGNPMLPFRGGIEGPNKQVSPGFWQQVGHGLATFGTDVGRSIEHPGTSQLPGLGTSYNTVPAGQRAASTTTTPNYTAPTQGMVPVHNGGLYALTPAQWKKAIALLPSNMKKLAKATAGASPVAVQQSAFTALMLDSYQKTGSWSKTIEQIAGGSPLGNAKGAGVASFATGVASEVNNQVSTLATQANNPLVITEPTAPDYQAEALAAAKNADPVGYYAANYASWGDELSKMLYGSPLSIIQSTADTFTGPVGSATSAVEAPTTPATPTPTAAPGA